MLRNGGRASLLGIPDRPVELNLVADIIFKGATVHGIYGRRMFETWVQTTELLKAGRLNLDPLFNERLPLDKYAEAFALLESGEAGKILFYPNGSSSAGSRRHLAKIEFGQCRNHGGPLQNTSRFSPATIAAWQLRS